MIIKGTGNSRFLRSVANAMTLYPTYESFIEALVAGTFPIDLNGINPSGVEQAGTKLNKASLLSDATAAMLGGALVPDNAFRALYQLSSKNLIREVFTASGSWTAPTNIADNEIRVIRVGGGGGGGGGSEDCGGGGGGSGHISIDSLVITPGSSYSFTIGAGGAGGAGGGRSVNGGRGGTGGTGGATTFAGLPSVAGGEGGGGAYYTSSRYIGGDGGNGGAGGGAGGGGAANLSESRRYDYFGDGGIGTEGGNGASGTTPAQGGKLYGDLTAISGSSLSSRNHVSGGINGGGGASQNISGSYFTGVSGGIYGGGGGGGYGSAGGHGGGGALSGGTNGGDGLFGGAGGGGGCGTTNADGSGGTGGTGASGLVIIEYHTV